MPQAARSGSGCGGCLGRGGDDGDPLHGEPLSPYVHARDAALVRQDQTGCALVFLGNTRSVEVQRLVELGWLGEVHPAKNQHPRVIPTDFQAIIERRSWSPLSGGS